MSEYLIFFIIVFGANLMPVFTPPGWWIFGVYLLNHEAELPLLVITGAVAAAAGRFLLGHATRRLGARFLSQSSRQNLSSARKAVEGRRRNRLIGFGVFAVSPIPSAQLFEAAGLAGVRLLPLTAVFLAGRIVAYSIYAYTAQGISQTSFGNMLRDEFTSPVGIALQVALLALLVLLTRIHWRKHLTSDRAEGKER